MIEGCLAYQQMGLVLPQTVVAAGTDYRRSVDTLQDFIDEECLVGHEYNCAANKIYDRYRQWTHEGGLKPMNLTIFGRQMVVQGFEKRRSNGIFYEGITVSSQ